MTNLNKAYHIHQPPLAHVPIRLGRLRLAYRWSRYFLWSATKGHFRGMRDSVRGLTRLAALSALDAAGSSRRVECNICGWHGRQFYPNAGSGYYELNVNCPRCHCIRRYRSLAVLLDGETEFFSPDKVVIEVAPVRSFQAYCLWRKQGKNYQSFDLARFGMEKGDITAMRYASVSCDYFLCFHVLEHIPAEKQAVKEIFRVLRPGGQAILQVPVDSTLKETIEYGKPDPFETGHVRRYSANGFSKSLTDEGFSVRTVSITDGMSEADVMRYGFDAQPVYIATKPASQTAPLPGGAASFLTPAVGS